MTRTDFLSCAAGLCSCAAFTSIPLRPAAADPEVEGLQWKLDFAQRRWARLVALLSEKLDELDRRAVWESLGRDHAREYRGLTDKFHGNLEGFLGEIRTQWVEKVDYDAAKGTIRIVDKSPVCTCPLVRPGLTPTSFCDCTLGWQKEAYAAVTGRPVEVVLEESILRGGNRCIFRIQIL